MKKLFFLNLFLFSVCNIYSQQIKRCSTSELEMLLLNANPNLQQIKSTMDSAMRIYIQSPDFKTLPTINSIITIPVVVHVIGDDAIARVTASKVQEQINILNQDYGKVSGSPGDGNGVSTGIQFCLATQDLTGNPTTGIINIAGAYGPFYNTLNDNVTLKSLSHWSPESYLNIWVCDIDPNLLGWGTFPYMFLGGSDEYQDGIVVGYKYFGNNTAAAPYGQGRTLTHEAGHWLNLYHTFQRGEKSNEVKCLDDYPTMNGDLCSDTPPVWNSNNPDPLDGGNYGSPAPGSVNTCHTDNPDLPDLTQDYMDYTNDACMNMFTSDQKDRLQATLSGPRSSLLFSIGCGSSGGGSGGGGSSDSYCQEGWKTSFNQGFGINYKGLQSLTYICEGDPIIITPCLGFPLHYKVVNMSGGEPNWWQTFWGAVHRDYSCEFLTSFYECNDDLSTTGHPEILTDRSFHAFYCKPTNMNNNCSTKSYYLADYDSPMHDIKYLSSTTNARFHLSPGKFYRFKLGGTYGNSYQEYALYFYIVPNDLLLDNRTLESFFGSNGYGDVNKYIAKNTVTIRNSTEAVGQSVDVVAGHSIIMEPGTDIRGTFTARINNVDCSQPQYARMAAPAIPAVSQTPLPLQDGFYANKKNMVKDSVNNKTNHIQVIPNPSTGLFYLTINSDQFSKDASPAFSITVSNVLGEVVYQSTTAAATTEIDLSAHPRGIYFVKVQSTDKVYTEKVILQ
ncbi:MAG: T9SS type A sorting domain-containing protein [Bacteroidetes bacterium]|nr:T9SS type A sorting domain-containing protein [Bacteroidota bacterium]